MSDYKVVPVTEAPDVLGDYPGEMRFLTHPLGAEQAALTWRRMPPGTGGRGAYGHRHKTQEEIYLVVSGTLTFKVGDDVVEVGPEAAIRVAPDTVRSVHNDGDEGALLVITSVKVEDLAADSEKVEGFWPE